MSTQSTEAIGGSAASIRAMLMPLVLAQFVCSYAASNMNVAITNIANDLGTTVSGIQTTITLFTLTMAALMIPGSKLTDIWGRKRCFLLGLTIYGLGALIAAAAPSLGVLTLGYSLLEGTGTALLIPPVYIFATVFFSDMNARARAFGSISAAAGVGAAAGPLIGGFITTTTSWRVSFIVQVLIVATVILLGRRIVDPGVQGERPSFDLVGAILSAFGLIFIVVGILQANTYGFFASKQDFVVGNTVVIPQGGISPMWLWIAIGAAVLAWFFLHIRSTERAGKQPLLSPRMFANRVSNLGLLTQNTQWLVLMGISFVASVYLQQVLHYSAIQTGVAFIPATLGILLAGARAPVMARRRAQRRLIIAGFILTLLGIFLLLVLSGITSFGVAALGLLFIGVGVGTMLTSSVNIVQSAWTEQDQGEISGLSRSVSNLGSSLGVAIAGTVLVSTLDRGGRGYAASLIVLAVIGLVGLLAAVLLPHSPVEAEAQIEPGSSPV